MPILLSEEDVRIVLSMSDLIPAMHEALAQFSAGRVEQPLRNVLEVGDQKAFFGVMPAYIQSPAVLGTKLVTVFGNNERIGLPSHLATIVLMDSTTGELLAVMDGRYITEARTAAVSAASVQLLARKGAGTLAILGSGVQARSHLEAIASVTTLRDVRVWSPREDRRVAFAWEMQKQGAPSIQTMGSAREAVEGADLIVLATASRQPVVESEWIADGAHVCAIGACRPNQREMDTALVKRARVYVDSRAAALAESGDIVIPIAERAIDARHIVGELGELKIGRVEGRRSDADVTIFKSLGMAVEDVAAAHLAYVRAAERGLGRGFVL
jgi:ornithine cyclodeaminase